MKKTTKSLMILSAFAILNIITPSSYAKTEEDWNKFIKEIRNIKKEELFKESNSNISSNILPQEKSINYEDVIILIPENINSGLKLAIEDLENYFNKVSKKNIAIKTYYGSPTSGYFFQKENINNKNVIIIKKSDDFKENTGLNYEENSSFSIKAKYYNINNKEYNIISLEADSNISLQYSIYHLMELTGKRFFYYKQEFTPTLENIKLPYNNFEQNFKTNKFMNLRGFSPHLYHPIPLSIAFQEPSEEHLSMMKEYIDWLVKNKQNYFILPMLELDKKSKYLPIRDESKPKFNEWLPFAQKIVDYAHLRGVKISIKLAFANFISSNSFAIDPFKALNQSVELDKKQEKINVNCWSNHNLEDKKIDCSDVKGYNELLEKYSKEDSEDIKKLIDDFMKVNWDDITWHLGTTEFSSTNDDLTINWMNTAYDYIKQKYPKVTMTVRSHVPPKPFSKKYNEAYFQLMKYANADINTLVHTVQAYNLIDYAPVYGADTFEHKLKYMFLSDKNRKNIFYPESSYWVTYDVDIPMFLPVYSLNRTYDVKLISQLDNLYGHATFTTGWEWGAWFNDYISAQVQSEPEKTLKNHLEEFFYVFGKPSEKMVALFKDIMFTQHEFLLDKNLHKYTKGVTWLTDFGVSLKHNPLTNSFFKGTDSTPERLRPEKLINYDKKELDNFINTDLSDLEILMNKFNDFSKNFDYLAKEINPETKFIYEEFADSLKINYLRTSEVFNLWKAVSLFRQAELDKNDVLKKEAKKYLFRSRRNIDDALVIIKKRESLYRDKPEYTYLKLEAPTIWNDRYLTSVHDAIYWETNYKEAEKIILK